MAVTFRNALDVPVFVRLFDQSDQIWIAALREFSIQPKKEFNWALNDTGPAPNWNRTQFQINIKEDYPVEIGVGIIDPPDLTPTTPPTLYDVNRVYLIYKEGGRIKLRVFVNPSLAITNRVANAILVQSRLGEPDRLEARLNMNDWHVFGLPIRVGAPDEYLRSIQVKFQVAYPNSPQPPSLPESARDLSRLTASGIATFNVLTLRERTLSK